MITQEQNFSIPEALSGILDSDFVVQEKEGNPARKDLLKNMFSHFKGLDPVYAIYDAIDELMQKKLERLKNESSSNKEHIEANIAQLKLVELFNAFNAIESTEKCIEDAYLNYEKLRRGVLTSGVLFKSDNTGNAVALNQEGQLIGYSINELEQLPWADFVTILNELLQQFEAIKSKRKIHIGNKWVFWPGCGMEIPEKMGIILDPDVVKTRMVARKKNGNQQYGAEQIIIDEKNYIVGFSVIGKEHKFFNVLNNGLQNDALKEGFFSINKRPIDEVSNQSNETITINQVNLKLENAEQYDCVIHIPYNSSKFDIRTKTKFIFNGGHEEQLIASTT